MAADITNGSEIPASIRAYQTRLRQHLERLAHCAADCPPDVAAAIDVIAGEIALLAAKEMYTRILMYRSLWMDEVRKRTAGLLGALAGEN